MQKHVTTVATLLPANATEIPAEATIMNQATIVETTTNPETMAAAPATVAMTILQNAQAAISNALAQNRSIAIVSDLGFTMRVVNTDVIRQPASVKIIQMTSPIQAIHRIQAMTTAIHQIQAALRNVLPANINVRVPILTIVPTDIGILENTVPMAAILQQENVKAVLEAVIMVQVIALIFMNVMNYARLIVAFNHAMTMAVAKVVINLIRCMIVGINTVINTTIHHMTTLEIVSMPTVLMKHMLVLNLVGKITLNAQPSAEPGTVQPTSAQERKVVRQNLQIPFGTQFQASRRHTAALHGVLRRHQATMRPAARQNAATNARQAMTGTALRAFRTTHCAVRLHQHHARIRQAVLPGRQEHQAR